ncbi:MAG: cytochrome C [Planctomycetes bacterium]|nr:cytochrome C [Planctomycetota bacterium]
MISERFGKELFVLMFCVLVSGANAVERPTSLQKTCVTGQCHADYNAKAHVHAPVSLGECKSCHDTDDVSKHTFKLARTGSDLCEYCHLDQASRENVHEPLKDGDCMQCHDPHSSDNKFLLPEKKVADLCNRCHQIGKGLKFLHGPTAVGECTICHDPHSSDQKNLLAMESSELCFSCHEITKDELEKFEFVHEPAINNCIGCHSGHGANNPKMLKAEAPQLCYSCHEDIKQIAETSKYQHSVVSQKGGCLKCHTPHASTIEFGLKAAPMTLCMSCHDKPVGISKDEVLPAFTNEIKGKKFMHGPLRQKDCGGCHTPHGSEYFRLLSKEYPPRFYAPFSKDAYQLCFSCHPESLVLTKETRDLTGFRNGDLNLHYLHVNRPQRGRTCRSCHATHASNLPKHIRKSVPYGRWELPIQFEKTETGGGCEPGCHLPAAYDRQSPVVYGKSQSSDTTN